MVSKTAVSVEANESPLAHLQARRRGVAREVNPPSSSHAGVVRIFRALSANLGAQLARLADRQDLEPDGWRRRDRCRAILRARGPLHPEAPAGCGAERLVVSNTLETGAEGSEDTTGGGVTTTGGGAVDGALIFRA